jgi:hypothetical protein
LREVIAYQRQLFLHPLVHRTGMQAHHRQTIGMVTGQLQQGFMSTRVNGRKDKATYPCRTGTFEHPGTVIVKFRQVNMCMSINQVHFYLGFWAKLAKIILYFL